MESWHLCQVDGGWRIRARVGGQGQHVGWEHFDGEDDEEEEDDEDKHEDDDQDDKDKDDKGEDDNGEQACGYVGWEHFDGEDDEEEVEDEKDDDGGQGQHMGRGRLCQHVASKVSQGNRPDRAALRRRDK